MSTTAIYPADVTDKFTTRLIRRKADELVAEGTFPPSEREDVIQNMTLTLLEQSANFDPQRAKWSTYVKETVHRIAVSLRRREDAECRRGRRDVASLSVLIPDEDGQLVELGATVSEAEYDAGLGRQRPSHTDAIDLTLDTQAVIDRLPENLREIAQRLKHQTVSQVAREMSIPRTTLLHHISKIRDAFADAGFGG